MANLRDIRRRIAGVKSTSKITQAMKLVAAAKLRRAQDAVFAARPYARTMGALMRHLLGRVEKTALTVLLEREETRGVLLVVVTADRGLCGPFNTNIIRAATQRIHETYGTLNAEGRVKLVCIGRRGYQHFVKRDYPVIGRHVGIVNAATLAIAKGIVSDILAGYMAGEYDRVEVVYNEFKSVIQQTLRIEQFLPIPAEASDVTDAEGHRYHATVDYIYEPSEEELMEYLVPKHLNFHLLRTLFESNAAEQGARMSAMDAATTNAKELIQTLQLDYNRARQASITKEILEVVGGAEALAKGG